MLKIFPNITGKTQDNFNVHFIVLVTDVRYFWDLLSGALITDALESVNGNVASAMSTVMEAISNLGFAPLTEYLQPLLQVLENNEFSNLFDMNTLRSYIAGERENSPVTQFVSSK